MPMPLTLILPYYRQPGMLRYQLRVLNHVSAALEVIIVDDGSPESALSVIAQYASPALRAHLRLYRILVDQPWNREECRNLGAQEAATLWIVQVDLDHLLPVGSVDALLAYQPQVGHWYRFPRYRMGKADETRQKDRLPRSCQFGAIHPHVDSYLVERDVYWQAGGYDEAFSGMLGGGGEFLVRLERTAGSPLLLPEPICLHVVTRHIIEDASDQYCDRDTEPGKLVWRAKQAQGLPKPVQWLLLPWERVL